MNLQGIYAPYIYEYLQFKRDLGYKLRDIEYTFGQFDQLTLKTNETVVGITRELADRWAEKRPNETLSTRYGRVSQIALLSKFLGNLGITSYVPELPKNKRSFVPYIFSKNEVVNLLSASDQYNLEFATEDSTGLVIPTLLRILYGTGLRIGEALALKEDDINMESKTIFVRESKNGTERLVPMSESLTTVCGMFLDCKRSGTAPQRSSEWCFVKKNGVKYEKVTIYSSFRRVLTMAGIPHQGKGLGPRLHDLRHTFACHSLAAMHQSGLDLYHSLPVLSTYLGHRCIESTEKYLQLTAEMFPGMMEQVAVNCGYVFPKAEREVKL